MCGGAPAGAQKPISLHFFCHWQFVSHFCVLFVIFRQPKFAAKAAATILPNSRGQAKRTTTTPEGFFLLSLFFLLIFVHFFVPRHIVCPRVSAQFIPSNSFIHSFPPILLHPPAPLFMYYVFIPSHSFIYSFILFIASSIVFWHPHSFIHFVFCQKIQ